MGRALYHGSKACIHCHVTKPRTEFGFDDGGQDGRLTVCRSCKSDIEQERMRGEALRAVAARDDPTLPKLPGSVRSLRPHNQIVAAVLSADRPLSKIDIAGALRCSLYHVKNEMWLAKNTGLIEQVGKAGRRALFGPSNGALGAQPMGGV